MSDRAAIDTITGYFYQFDKTILEILKQQNDSDSIRVEGIEDIDIINAGEIDAVQCKYYAKTEYNHSVIKKTIALMLEHFSANKDSGIRYHLFGHYKSGHDKLGEITLANLKTNFLTSQKTTTDASGSKSKTTIEAHNILGLTDSELSTFLELLTVDINAPSFEDQYTEIITTLKSILGVSHTEADLYHYNTALKVVQQLSIAQNISDREITKKDFIEKIEKKDELFDSWFIRRKGRKSYIKTIRAERLSTGLNMESFDRFFLIDSCNIERLNDFKEIISLISKKWSKISTRQIPCFCPAIYFFGLSPEIIIRLKKELFSENCWFVDAFPFKDSDLSCEHFYTEPSLVNKLKFRFIDTLDDLSTLIDGSQKRVEIYQFYKEEVFFNKDDVKHEKIKIESTDYVKDMVK